MFDVNLIDLLFVLLIGLLWIIACVGVAYGFIAFISRAMRPGQLWRHIFETIILIGASLLWLSFGDDWPEQYQKWRADLPLAGTVILIAYLYSSYRKRVFTLWLEIPLQLCLLAGLLSMTLLTLTTANKDSAWFFVGIPIDLLFAINFLTNLQKWRSRPPAPGTPFPNPPGTKILEDRVDADPGQNPRQTAKNAPTRDKPRKTRRPAPVLKIF